MSRQTDAKTLVVFGCQQRSGGSFDASTLLSVSTMIEVVEDCHPVYGVTIRLLFDNARFHICGRYCMKLAALPLSQFFVA